MNYLFHLYIADQCDSSRVGNFLGDFVKGPIERLSYQPAIIEGIRLHRIVDSFSDQHPLIREACRSLGSEARRVAPVLVDLLFDHYLARSWHTHCPSQPLPRYTRQFYAELDCFLSQTTPDELPRLQQIFPSLSRQDWISHYASTDGINQTIVGVSHRLRCGELMRQALPGLHQQEPRLLALFEAFLPELVQFSQSQVAQWRAQP